MLRQLIEYLGNACGGALTVGVPKAKSIYSFQHGIVYNLYR